MNESREAEIKSVIYKLVEFFNLNNISEANAINAMLCVIYSIFKESNLDDKAFDEMCDRFKKMYIDLKE
jgi:hypothetical protein